MEYRRPCRCHRCVSGDGHERAAVLPPSVVDNSDFSPTRLTAGETRLMLASQGVLPLPISNSEDRYGPSCVRVPAGGLSPSLSGEARAS